MMHSEMGNVALISFLMMTLPALCTFSERMETYAAELTNPGRINQVYPNVGTSRQGESLEESHQLTRPAKHPRGDQDQVLAQQDSGSLPIFEEKHAKMRLAHSELKSELQLLETSLNRPDFKNLVTYERNIYRRLQDHIIGWFNGMADEPMVSYEKRVTSIVKRLKYSLDQVTAHTSTPVPMFKESTAHDNSLAKLELKLQVERMLFLTLKYLHDIQKVNNDQLSEFFSDLKTLKQLGNNIHDIYQLHNPSKFIPSISQFIQDPLLKHLHHFFPALPWEKQMVLAHVVFSKTCQTFQQNDHLRLNIIHPNFHKFINNVTDDEFLTALLVPQALRKPFEQDLIAQRIKNGKKFVVGEEVKASIKDGGFRCKKNLGWNPQNDAKLDLYLLAVEDTESILHFFAQSSLAQLESEGPEEQRRVENGFQVKLNSRTRDADELAAKILFHPRFGTCQARAAPWQFWFNPYPWETEALHSNQELI